MTALLQPEVLTAYLSMWAHQIVMQLTWCFDMLISFVLAFAFLYGVFSFSEKLFPPRLGRRPRVWIVPLLFVVVILGFPFFIDAFVATVFHNLMDSYLTLPAVEATNLAACLWLGGFAVTLVRTLKGFGNLAKTAKSLPAYPNNPELKAALAATGIRKSAIAKTGAHGSTIFSCGLWRKYIILPDDFAMRYSPEERYAILLHECIHIRNHDTFKLFFLSLAKAVLWFDPVSRHAMGRVKADTELLCDWTAVNAHRLDPAAYAVLIVKAASEQQRITPGFSDTYRLITHRLSRILCDREVSAPERVSRLGSLLILAGLVWLAVEAAIFYAHIPPTQAIRAEGVFENAALEILRHEERNGVFARYSFIKVHGQ